MAAASEHSPPLSDGTSDGSDTEEGSSSDSDATSSASRRASKPRLRRRRALAWGLGLACLALTALLAGLLVWRARGTPAADPGIEALFRGIARYVRTHLPNVTNDWDDTRCRANEAMPFSLTSCNYTRYQNVTGFPQRSDENIAFCLASAFGAPDTEGNPPQCRWDDVNDISEEMGWADAAVYNPEWDDNCSSLKVSGGYWDYCDCLDQGNSYWFEVFKSNLLKYCHDKFLIVLHRKDGSIGFSQRCELRWILRHSIQPLSCPIIPWTFDQLWEFRSAICRARQGVEPAGSIEQLLQAASRQVVPLISKDFRLATSSPVFKRYLDYLTYEKTACWAT